MGVNLGILPSQKTEAFNQSFRVQKKKNKVHSTKVDQQGGNGGGGGKR